MRDPADPRRGRRGRDRDNRPGHRNRRLHGDRRSARRRARCGSAALRRRPDAGPARVPQRRRSRPRASLGNREARPDLHPRGNGEGRLHLRRDRGDRWLTAPRRPPQKQLRDDRECRHARKHGHCTAGIHRISRPRAPRALDPGITETYLPAVTAALNIESSISGQPWRWRRQAESGLGMDDLVDELLLARGIARDDLPRHRDPKIRDFLPDPSCFKDMDKGAKRLADAVQAAETIAIFGDYDVDGATSAALLVLLLRRLGAEPIVYIPDRLMEGYGPSGSALVELKGRGASVAVCVDCGAQAFEALEQAAAAGLDVIVVDHHQCASLLPLAHALINPNRSEERREGAAHGHRSEEHTSELQSRLHLVCRL